MTCVSYKSHTSTSKGKHERTLTGVSYTPRPTTLTTKPPAPSSSSTHDSNLTRGHTYHSTHPMSRESNWWGTLGPSASSISTTTVTTMIASHIYPTSYATRETASTPRHHYITCGWGTSIATTRSGMNHATSTSSPGETSTSPNRCWT